MRIKHTLIAFAVLAVLGGVFFYLDRMPEMPRADAIPKEGLFPFTADEVEEFTLSEASGPSATFRRIAATSDAAGSGAETESEAEPEAATPQWEVVEPEGVAADSNQIQAFLEEIAGMQASSLTTEVAPVWSEYGLESPEKSYLFKLKDGKTVEFSIGVENPAGYARYARRDGAAPLLLIDTTDTRPLIEKTLFDLRDKRILPLVENANRIELRFNLGGAQPSADEVARARQLGLTVKASRIVISKQPNGNWQLDEPLLRTDFNTANYLFSTLSHGILQTIEAESAPSLSQYGLARPEIRVDVSTDDGVKSLLVGSQVTRDEQQLYYAKNTVWPHVFTIPRTTYDQLNQDFETYRERYLYDFDQINARSIEIDGPTGRYSFELRGEEWFMTGGSERQMDYVKMSNFLNFIHSLRIASYTSDEPGQFARYGLDEPWMTTNVTFTADNKKETVVYSRHDGEFYAARVGEPSVYKLSPHEPDNLVTKIEELVAEPAAQPPADSQAPAGSPAPATE
jgi:hypothetical protein